jgi:hypothetical protein
MTDAAFRDWWASYLRMGASPGAAVALTRMNAEIDIRDVLPSVRVPTLVLHRSGDRLLKVEEGRYLASRIPTATFVELPGDDHLPFVGDQDAILREVDRFLSFTHPRPSTERVLASVLTVKWEQQSGKRVNSTLASAFDREIASARGHRLVLSNDRMVASFDGPGRAVRCGTGLLVYAMQSGIAARAGLHIGERVLTAQDDHVIQVSASMADAALPGELCVSRTIVDLLPGSGLRFESRGHLSTPTSGNAIAVLAVAG